ncbi:MAG: hypothetical protein ACREJC_05380, partial [Tepidisphaeraceae bacterium]
MLKHSGLAILGGLSFVAPSVALACSGVPCSPSMCVGARDAWIMAHQSPTPVRGGSGGATQDVAFASSGVKLLSNVTLAAMGGGSGASLYGWVDPLTHREYAIMGRSNGTAFVDITDPVNPVYVANLPKIAGTTNEIWREPKVYKNTVYVGVDRQSATPVGMQVMDLKKLR